GGVEPEPDLLVVNRYEYERIEPGGSLVALTLGAEGAVLLEHGREIARARPPSVTAVDGTAAGDAFCAALVVSLLEGRERDAALARACAAGALAASRPGAQPSLPTADEVDALLRRDHVRRVRPSVGCGHAVVAEGTVAPGCGGANPVGSRGLHEAQAGGGVGHQPVEDR